MRVWIQERAGERMKRALTRAGFAVLRGRPDVPALERIPELKAVYLRIVNHAHALGWITAYEREDFIRIWGL